MKIRITLTILFVVLLTFPANVFAIGKPTYDSIPGSVDADIYTIVFHTEEGAKISVIGGPAAIPPVTDGIQNPLDGIVEITVGLSQDTENTFSVVASINDDFSESMTITIHEFRAVNPHPNGLDITPPDMPILNEYPETVASDEWVFDGIAEPGSVIEAHWPDGALAGSVATNTKGFFSLEVDLMQGKTNRLNFTATDDMDNSSKATQAVVRVPAEITDNEMRTTEIKKPKIPVIGNGTQALPPPFNDIVNHWAEAYITELWENDVVSGKSYRTFDPNGQITRAELTKIAVNAFGYEVPASVTSAPFADVPPDAWFAPYLEVAKTQNLAEGYPDGFHPNDPINRASALKILMEAAGMSSGEPDPVDFRDVSDDAWFTKYIELATAFNIVSGYSDNTFRPGNAITRAEVSKIVIKLQEVTSQ